MESMNSDVDSRASMVTNAKLKSADTGPASGNNTMDSFQDGGGPNMSLDRTPSEFAQSQNVDGAHMNSDMNSFQGVGDQGGMNPNYSKMNDGMANSQMSGYNAGYNRGCRVYSEWSTTRW